MTVSLVLTRPQTVPIPGQRMQVLPIGLGIFGGEFGHLPQSLTPVSPPLLLSSLLLTPTRNFRKRPDTALTLTPCCRPRGDNHPDRRVRPLGETEIQAIVPFSKTGSGESWPLDPGRRDGLWRGVSVRPSAEREAERGARGRTRSVRLIQIPAPAGGECGCSDVGSQYWAGRMQVVCHQSMDPNI